MLQICPSIESGKKFNLQFRSFVTASMCGSNFIPGLPSAILPANASPSLNSSQPTQMPDPAK